MPPGTPRRVALDLRGLSGRDDVFRVGLGKNRQSAVDDWLASEPAELRSIARHWFAKMRRCGRDVRELLHDGCPVACLEDAPFAYVATFKSHVNVGFFRGAMLDDPTGLLAGSGKRMRHVKVVLGRPVDAAALGNLIDAAYAELKARLRAESAEGDVSKPRGAR